MQQYSPSTSYQRPSFFDVEATRERLETQLRAESFPVTMATMARRAEAMHNIYQKEVNIPEGDINNPEYRKSVMEEAFSLEIMMRTPEEIETILAKFGSTKGKEFDVCEYMESFYADPNSWGHFHPQTKLVAHTYEKITKRGTDGPGVDEEKHLQTAYRHSYEQGVERLRRLRAEKPWLVEFSEKYIDVFGATFVGNGHRTIEGYEGLNFLDGVEEATDNLSEIILPSKSAVQLSPEKERAFIESIVGVEPLGMLPVHETEIIDGREVWNHDFNGWGGYTEAFLFRFKDREHMIGYLNRSFTSGQPKQEGEGWLVFSESRAKELLLDKVA